ncbi:DUF1080 domain-containing protein [Sphingobacterium sp. SGR-19]|uniref:3-keto-disaccharide hydrolase n=1 Tax=Sphingobacterium sp. SGR-19 TaxID=2710886 RepID=UPI0013EAD346|nr:DUF1080 domain-containing protein [Sphingobacterium sp. SGR-19]NGM64858.1 DUF1080 domain-containing protein [Sphingobacterium sp. SGR-19]
MKKRFMYMVGVVVAMSTTICQAQNATAVGKNVPPHELNHLPKVDISKLQKNADGTYVLFNGTSLEGWRGYNKEKVPAKWRIEDGTLKFSSKGSGLTKEDGGDIIFAHDFQNFELEFEWKISHAGNSGVFFLAKEVKGQPIYISSPEYQLLDNENHPDAKQGVDGNRKSGSLYDMIPAKPQNGKPAGEWNKAKIVVNNGKVTHYQNGEKVVEYSIWTPEWTALLQASKFSQEKWPLAFELLNNVGGESKSGVIGFQDHGDDVWLKNITVKVL